MKKKILSYVLVFIFAFVITAQTTPKTVYAALALPQCQDGFDNDLDVLIDNLDPQCHTDGNVSNPFSYDANIDNEASPVGGNISGSVVSNGNSGGGGGSGGGRFIGINPFLPQVLGASTVACGIETGRPCLLQRMGGDNLVARTAINRKANNNALVEKDRLTISSLGIDKPILQLPSIDSLFREAMILPWTSTPDKGGNTVLVGHAYYKKNGNFTKSTFYELDTMKIGDEIKITWKGINYTYVVTENKKVTPDQIEIEDSTTTPTLTIYSCGRFTNILRTVIVATLKV